jgi:hypothetical protein
MNPVKSPSTAPLSGSGAPLAREIMALPPFGQAQALLGVVLELVALGGESQNMAPGRGLGRRGEHARSPRSLFRLGEPGRVPLPLT